ncbi:ciliary-associated calcium-binding coiled-coil protein 1 [Nematostella vectensis]|uniref:ciliary-associated calcium-binding coiled-coil protein 1 n=1 Tax=Nematostella vectensis TaxID=45351 RepID=UPI0020776A09|nr:ciliary-associated calcium-binding coiled-coil protein 1 [Nematostella vectensis]
MAEPKKSRSAIRVKSSDRKKSAKQGDNKGRRSSQEEEEVKESLAWKVLSEEQTLSLKELTVTELEAKMAEILGIENYHISLPEACVLDYYVAGFWFTKEQNFNTQQGSAFVTVLKILLENIKEKQLSLVESLKEFRNLLVGIGVENCPKTGGLECFDVSQAKLITDYFTESLFKHYKLYKFLFTQEPEEEVTNTELTIEVPPLACVPFPPPLDEGMTEEVWRAYIMTPPPSPQPEKETEEDEGKADSSGISAANKEVAENILASLKPEDIKTIVKKAAEDTFGSFKLEVETKLKERESNYIAKIGGKAK